MGSSADTVLDRLSETSPDLGEWIVDFVFGDVFDRDALAPREREIAIIGALTALGFAGNQLRLHIGLGRGPGCHARKWWRSSSPWRSTAAFPPP